MEHIIRIPGWIIFRASEYDVWAADQANIQLIEDRWYLSRQMSRGGGMIYNDGGYDAADNAVKAAREYDTPPTVEEDAG